ncbi:MAG TPA: hypothetical protein VGQ20_16780 [Acidimicrobiales bacterium]|jgi:hypothetical protein|nr:hypothetical protein [Acidimicrobiales bacterium]
MTEQNPSPEQIAAIIATFLRTPDGSRRRTSMLDDPMERPEGVNRETWRRWFERLPHHREPALRALEVLQRNDGRVPRGTHVIRRHDLAALAATARDDRDRTVTLFVATMMWGSGCTNGRGPRYTDAALRDRRLVDTLQATAALVASGCLAEAHKRFEIKGIGPSFFTKWLWASALGDHHLEHQPLVLDTRVITTVNRLGWQLHRVGDHHADRYAGYVRDAHQWAALVTMSIDQCIRAEHIQWLLFERNEGSLSHALAHRAVELMPG